MGDSTNILLTFRPIVKLLRAVGLCSTYKFQNSDFLKLYSLFISVIFVTLQIYFFIVWYRTGTDKSFLFYVDFFGCIIFVNLNSFNIIVMTRNSLKLSCQILKLFYFHRNIFPIQFSYIRSLRKFNKSVMFILISFSLIVVHANTIYFWLPLLALHEWVVAVYISTLMRLMLPTVSGIMFLTYIFLILIWYYTINRELSQMRSRHRSLFQMLQTLKKLITADELIKDFAVVIQNCFSVYFLLTGLYAYLGLAFIVVLSLEMQNIGFDQVLCFLWAVYYGSHLSAVVLASVLSRQQVLLFSFLV